MKVNYLVQNRLSQFILSFVDFFGYRFFTRKTKSPPTKIQKILLCNIAHLGDAVIFSSLLPSFDKKIEIGILIHSSSECIFTDNPRVKWIHCIDHWKLNRSSVHICKKIIRYFLQKRKVVASIKKVKYDAAFDFYPFFPNANSILWKSSIPNRIGYNSGGFGFLLTKDLSWIDSNQFILNYHIKLLENIFPKYSLDEIKPNLVIKNTYSIKANSYIIFHIGTGNPVKEWPEKKWKELIKQLQLYNDQFVFTGQGIREKQQVRNIIDESKDSNNLVDQLSLPDLMEVISKAKLLVCCDSLPVHLAWAFERPAVVLQIGTDDPDLWTPPNPKASYIRPCLDKQEISVETVLQKIQEKLD